MRVYVMKDLVIPVMLLHGVEQPVVAGPMENVQRRRYVATVSLIVDGSVMDARINPRTS